MNPVEMHTLAFLGLIQVTAGSQAQAPAPLRLCGWETRSMFDRYNIIDEADLAAAVAQRFNGKQRANIAPSTATPDSVTSSRSSS